MAHALGLLARLAIVLMGTDVAAAAWAQPCEGWLPGEGFPGVAGVTSVYAEYDGELIAGGNFATAGGVVVNNIARWDSVAWRALGSGMAGGAPPYFPSVYALVVYNGELVAGGNFDVAGEATVNNVARWDGTMWRPLASGVGGAPSPSSLAVNALTVYNGELIAGGDFTTAGGVAAKHIARWNGVEWSALGGPGSGMNDLVYALTVFHGELIAGGVFTTAGGTVASRIARWDGSTWRSLGSGVDYNLYSLTIFRDELIAGGWFTVAGGVTVNGVARWNGSTWQALGSGFSNGMYLPGAFALRAFNGELIAAGGFSESGAVALNNIARWNGNEWRPLGAGVGAPYEAVSALALWAGDLVAGGYFSIAGGQPVEPWAYWRNATGDATNDDRVDFLDLNAVLSGYGGTGDPGTVLGDVNNDGACDMLDLNAVLGAYGSMCAP